MVFSIQAIRLDFLEGGKVLIFAAWKEILVLVWMLVLVVLVVLLVVLLLVLLVSRSCKR